MSDDAAPAGATPGPANLQAHLAAFLAELEAGTLALDGALHFDERASVKPAYDRLMRIADAYRDLPGRLKHAYAPPPDAHAADRAAGDELIAAVDGIVAVLGEMAAGVERYHGLAGTLARLQARLASAVARRPQ